MSPNLRGKGGPGKTEGQMPASAADHGTGATRQREACVVNAVGSRCEGEFKNKGENVMQI